MLTIRMQRTGRTGYANFRVVVQDSRFSPSSGRVVAKIGHYNPHTKEVVLDKEKASEYLKNGAQPSPRVTKLLKAEKISLPDWVNPVDTSKKRSVRKPEKLRKNQPKEEPAAEVVPEAETPVEEVATEAVETQSEETTEEAVVETETPAETSEEA